MAINELTDLGRGVTLSKHLPAISMGLLSFIPLWITLHLYRFSYDDAYITFRYAKNIAAGHGFVYNVGESYLGTTTPLYAILLATLNKLLPFLSVPEIGGVVSGLSLTFCGWFICLTARRSNQALIGILSALFIFLNPLLVMTFGGEALFFLMLTSGAFYFYFAKKGYLTTLLLALALLTRGDGVISALIVAGHYFFAEKKIPYKPLILFLLIISPWFLYSLCAFGSIFPATLEAKIAQGKSGLWMTFPRGAWEWVKGFLRNDRRYAVGIPMAVVGLIHILISEGPWFLLLMWVTLLTVGYTFLGVSFYHWYIAPLGLMLAILIALGGMAIPGFLKNLFELMNDWYIGRKKMPNDETVTALNAKLSSLRGNLTRVYFLSLALVALCTVAVLAAEVKSVVPLLYRDHIDAREDIYTRVGQWLSENMERDATVAYLEIGYIGYYTDRRIIDLLGLVTPEIGSHIRESDFAWGFLRYEPDYYIYNPNFAGWTKVIDQEPWFRAAYKEVAEISGAGHLPLTIYKKTANASLPGPLKLDYPLRSWTIQHPLHLNLNGQIELLGYDLSADQVRPGGILELTLYWHALTELERDYTVFTHLLGESYNLASGNFLWGQKDNMPLDGTYPTSRWLENEVVVDSYAIAVQPDAPPELYRIEVGMYLLETGQRLPVFDDQGQRMPEDRALLGETIEVVQAK